MTSSARPRALRTSAGSAGCARARCATRAPLDHAGRASRRRGFSLVDVCLALSILAVALSVLVGGIFSILKLDDANEESIGATLLARSILEDVGAMPFDEVFAAYNADPEDDPEPGVDYLGALTASERLLELGKKGGAVATIAFPGDGFELREDAIDPRLGMPRDLDGDGAIDGADHADDYRLLPLLLRLEWAGASGTRAYEIVTVLKAP